MVSSELTEFIAFLVFQESDRRRTITPFACSTTHPEIAYQLALAQGREERYGLKFIGIGELAVNSDDPSRLGMSEGGNADELVVAKSELSAFSEPRWMNKPHDENELAAALAGPPLLMELAGLNSVDWENLSHAYGAAKDVPLDLQRLASSDAEVRKRAAWRLWGSIYHQGDIFSATATAVPFLSTLLSTHSLPNRFEIASLLGDITESACVPHYAIRNKWTWQQEKFGKITSKQAAQGAESEIANLEAVHRALVDCECVFREQESDADSSAFIF